VIQLEVIDRILYQVHPLERRNAKESHCLTCVSTLAQTNASPFLFHVTDRDILAEHLADKRSENTRRAYARDVKDFFVTVANQEPTPTLIGQFLSLERAAAISLVLKYKAILIERNLSEATVNRRLSALKSLVAFAQKVDRCQWSLEQVESEKVQSYRDTSGISLEAYRKLLSVPNRNTLAGRRNYAILRLLWENALRRNEISQTNVGDLDIEARTLQIFGKGKGTQAESISLSTATTEAIVDWVLARDPVPAPNAPLFVALDRAHYGHRLSGNAIYNLVVETATSAGITKHLSPHRCRHSAITAALNATNGNVREVQKLSRHARLETLMIYDDNRANAQGKVTNLLADLL